jgi:hypothetical protein
MPTFKKKGTVFLAKVTNDLSVFLATLNLNNQYAKVAKIKNLVIKVGGKEGTPINLHV